MWNSPLVAMESLRVLPLLVFAIANTASGQTIYDGSVVQSELNAAIAAGQTSYTLPPGRINLSASLWLPPGTSSFTLKGQTGSRLVRNSSSDFPLVVVGTNGSHGYDNSAFTGSATSIAPAQEGSISLTRTGGQTLVPGWYGLIGTNPQDDFVRTPDGATTFAFKRELVRVLSVAGNVATLEGPIGRSFGTGEMRFLESQVTAQHDKKVCQRISLQNLVLDGTSAVDASKASKVLVIGVSNGVYVDDVSVSSFSTSGISVLFSKGVTINRARISLGRNDALGYGIEFVGSRFVTVRNSNFSTTRTGVLFQGGTMDALVSDCLGPTLNFDVGHGQGEKRLTYRRVLADKFAVANTTWRRGVDGATIEDCTAFDSITVNAGAANVLIKGKYSGQASTTPMIVTTTATGGNGIPNGDAFVHSLTLEDGTSLGTPDKGYNFYMVESSPDAPCMLGSLTIRNWTFKTLFGAPSNLRFTRTTNSPTISIHNSTFENVYEYGAPLYFGASGTNRWNLDLQGNSFNVPGQYVVQFHTNSTASWTNLSNLINGNPVTLANVNNPGALQ